MIELLRDERYGIEWHECACCGEQGDPAPLGSLDPSARNVECYLCNDDHPEGC